jgi:hypothetical protein
MLTAAPFGILLASVVGGFLTPVIITYIAIKYGLAGGISSASLFALLTGIWIFPETKGKRIEI